MLTAVAAGRHRGVLPGAPTGLAQSAVTTTSISVTWSPPTTGGALDHGVYTVQDTLHGGTFANLATVQYCTSTGSVTDAFGNSWSIGPTGPNGLYCNGVYVNLTNAVILVYLVAGTVWQENGSNGWYSFTPTQNYGATPPDGSAFAGPFTASPLVITTSGLQSGQSYDFKVDVSNSSGTGPFCPVVTISTSSSGTGSLAFMLGYGGGGNGAGTTSQPPVPAEETWLGRAFDLRVGTSLTNGSYTNGPWESSKVARRIGQVVGIPMISIYGESPALTDMAVAASGGYNSSYLSVINNIKSLGSPIIAIRPGWECNGNWYLWSPNGGGTNASVANYVATFKHISQLVHANMPGTLVEWNTAINFDSSVGGTDLDLLFPGKYNASTNPGGCDVMAMDWYEANNGPWSSMLAGSFGLNWFASFSASTGVPMVFSEVGLGDSSSVGGETSGIKVSDNASLTNSMISWITSQGSNFLYCIVSPWEPCADLSSSSLNPNITGALHSAYSGTSFGRTIGNWYTGTKVPSEP